MMAEMIEGSVKTFPASEAIPQYARVKLASTGKVAVAGATEFSIGVAERPVIARADGTFPNCPVRLRTAEGTRKMIAAGTIVAGASVYGAALGKVDDTDNNNLEGVYFSGVNAAAGDIIEVMNLDAESPATNTNKYIVAATDASAAVTNTAVETAFDNHYDIDANDLAVGDVIRVVMGGIAPATNTSATLAVKLKIGSVTVAAIAALDVADGALFQITSDIVVREIGASGKIVAAGQTFEGAPGTQNTNPYLLAETALDTTADSDITATATWSAANVGNSCRMDVLNVQHLKAAP